MYRLFIALILPFFLSTTTTAQEQKGFFDLLKGLTDQIEKLKPDNEYTDATLEKMPLINQLGARDYSPDNLKRASAIQIGGQVRPDQIRIYNLEDKIGSLRWEARTPNGDFDCSSDIRVNNPHCIEKARYLTAPD